MSRGIPRLVECHDSSREVPRLVSWKRHVLSRGKQDFHGKLGRFTRKILRGFTRGHAWKNEVVNELYRTCIRVIVFLQVLLWL